MRTSADRLAASRASSTSTATTIGSTSCFRPVTIATRRYPVLYLFHTAFTDQDQWLERSDVEAFTADRDVIVVMPYQGPIGDVMEPEQRYEAFDLALIGHIDQTYRTIGDRAHRAVAGVSGGAYFATYLAARHPDLFSSVGGFSTAFYDFTEMSPAKDVVVFSFFQTYAIYCFAARERDGSGVCDWPHGPTEPASLVGEPVTDDLHWHERSVTDLASNLDGMSIYISSGNGVPCDGRDLNEIVSSGNPFTAGEPYSHRETRLLSAALARSGVAHTADLYGCGIHSVDSWRYYNRALGVFWDHMTAAFATAPPSSFDYRSPESALSVWDWTFAADPARAPEFLDVTDTSCDGVGLTGSGITTVTTATCFAPGNTVALAGAVESAAVADADGRVTFHVDLGPAHEFEQYTPVARVQEAASGYWTTKTVIFETS